jgi:hypothetical protein
MKRFSKTDTATRSKNFYTIKQSADVLFEPVSE